MLRRCCEETAPWNSGFSRQNKAIGSVRLSVRHSFPLYTFKLTDLELDFLYVYGGMAVTIARLGLKVKVIGKVNGWVRVRVEY